MLAASKPCVATNNQEMAIQQHRLANPIVPTASYLFSTDMSETSLGKPRLAPRKARKGTGSPKQKGKKRRRLLEHEPILTQRAWLYSAVLPGLGQAYNQTYWKIAMIYGIFGGLAWGAIYNHQEYRESRRELIELTSKRKQNYSLQNYVDSRKRDRNLFILIAGLWYIVNVFDAYVEGRLKTFDVSDNLEVILEPTQSPTARHEPTIGLSLTLSLKQ